MAHLKKNSNFENSFQLIEGLSPGSMEDTLAQISSLFIFPLRPIPTTQVEVVIRSGASNKKIHLRSRNYANSFLQIQSLKLMW